MCWLYITISSRGQCPTLPRGSVCVSALWSERVWETEQQGAASKDKELTEVWHLCTSTGKCVTWSWGPRQEAWAVELQRVPQGWILFFCPIDCENPLHGKLFICELFFCLNKRRQKKPWKKKLLEWSKLTVLHYHWVAKPPTCHNWWRMWAQTPTPDSTIKPAHTCSVSVPVFTWPLLPYYTVTRLRPAIYDLNNEITFCFFRKIE